MVLILPNFQKNSPRNPSVSLLLCIRHAHKLGPDRPVPVTETALTTRIANLHVLSPALSQSPPQCAREMLLFGAELTVWTRRDTMRAYSTSEQQRAGWGGVLRKYYRGCSPPPHPWPAPRPAPWFAEPAFVLFTAFRSRVESVPRPRPERRACSSTRPHPAREGLREG